MKSILTVIIHVQRHLKDSQMSYIEKFTIGFKIFKSTLTIINIQKSYLTDIEIKRNISRISILSSGYISSNKISQVLVESSSKYRPILVDYSTENFYNQDFLMLRNLLFQTKLKVSDERFLPNIIHSNYQEWLNFVQLLANDLQKEIIQESDLFINLVEFIKNEYLKATNIALIENSKPYQVKKSISKQFIQSRLDAIRQ